MGYGGSSCEGSGADQYLKITATLIIEVNNNYYKFTTLTLSQPFCPFVALFICLTSIKNAEVLEPAPENKSDE